MAFLEDFLSQLRWSDADGKLLRDFAPGAQAHFLSIVEEFYAEIASRPRGAAVFVGGQAQIDRLKGALLNWMETGLSGPWDEAFYKRRARIGRVHVDIGLPQEFMFSAMNLIRLRLMALTPLGADGDGLRAALNKWLDLELAIMLRTSAEASEEVIRASEQEMRRLNENLEAKVEQRTNDLRTALGTLQEERGRMVQMEKLSAVGLLASGVAHEINNPLSGVRSCFKAIVGGQLTEGRLQQYVETVEDGFDRMEKTVRGLLDFSKQRPPALESVNVVEVVDASTRLVGPAFRKKMVTVSHDIPDGTRVTADRPQLMQVLVNVLLNAIHATPRGSSVTVTHEHRDGSLGVVIRDQGMGIPSDLRHRVFDPFFTTKPEGEGTGLGLSVTLGLLQANGGGLEIGDAPGGGAEVSIWLPEG